VEQPAPIGPVAQWLEPTAHNGLVGGSSPARPTIFNVFRVYTLLDRSRMFAFSSRISLVNRWSAHLVRDEGVAGSNPATPTNFPTMMIATGPIWGTKRFRALAAQDLALSRRKQGFESPRERQRIRFHFDFPLCFRIFPKPSVVVWASSFGSTNLTPTARSLSTAPASKISSLPWRPMRPPVSDGSASRSCCDSARG
jgi:hypothetical protein